MAKLNSKKNRKTKKSKFGRIDSWTAKTQKFSKHFFYIVRKKILSSGKKFAIIQLLDFYKSVNEVPISKTNKCKMKFGLLLQFEYLWLYQR